jgi:hypothetical protein
MNKFQCFRVKNSTISEIISTISTFAILYFFFAMALNVILRNP